MLIVFGKRNSSIDSGEDRETVGEKGMNPGDSGVDTRASFGFGGEKRFSEDAGLCEHALHVEGPEYSGISKGTPENN